ncbi:hypothetical protein [Nocardioides cynanchi]|uniref:hypothetical protein n=1 Tax=Nocardioides cynanchi TaxID=2558918 RepID=UPI001246D384|nr:hypothetical protein [Nocardioides cynanchi]
MTVRLVAATAVLVSAYVHLHLWLDGFRHDHVVGPLFMVNVVAGVAIAALLVTWRSWPAPFLAFGFGASTLGGFVIAAQWGLFGDHEKWQGPYVWTATAAEAVAILTGLYLLATERRTAPVAQRSTVGAH